MSLKSEQQTDTQKYRDFIQEFTHACQGCDGHEFPIFYSWFKWELSIEEVVLLSDIVYWSLVGDENESTKSGEDYCIANPIKYTSEQMSERLRLNPGQQERLLRSLEAKNFIRRVRRGVPPYRHIQINFDVIDKKWRCK